MLDIDPPTKGFFRIRFQMSVPNFIIIGLKLRPWERGQTDRHTRRHTHRDRQRWHGWSYNL